MISAMPGRKGRINRFRAAAWLILLAVAATSVAPFIRVAGMSPDFFLIFVAVLSLRGRKEGVLTMAWLCGLAKDLLSEGRLGVYAALFVIAAYLLLNIREYLSVDMIKVRVWIGAIAGLTVNLLYILVALVYNSGMGVVETLGRLAAAVVMTALLTPLFAFFARGCAESLNIAERRPNAYL